MPQYTINNINSCDQSNWRNPFSSLATNITLIVSLWMVALLFVGGNLCAGLSLCSYKCLLFTLTSLTIDSRQPKSHLSFRQSYAQKSSQYHHHRQYHYHNEWRQGKLQSSPWQRGVTTKANVWRDKIESKQMRQLFLSPPWWYTSPNTITACCVLVFKPRCNFIGSSKLLNFSYYF